MTYKTHRFEAITRFGMRAEFSKYTDACAWLDRMEESDRGFTNAVAWCTNLEVHHVVRHAD